MKFYNSPVWCFPILLYKYSHLREARSLADRRVERIRWIELFGSVSLQQCHAAGCRPMAFLVQFFVFDFFTESKRLKNIFFTYQVTYFSPKIRICWKFDFSSKLILNGSKTSLWLKNLFIFYFRRIPDLRPKSYFDPKTF